MDSLRLMMPEAGMWPQGAHVGPARFLAARARRAAHRSASASRRATAARTTSADWVELAQFVNYEGYRAMFEAQSKNRMGLLIWMSHPTLAVVRLADVRLLPGADGRLLRRQEGSRAAAHPMESGDRQRGSGELQRRRRAGLNARGRVLNMDGAVKWRKTAALDSAEDSVASPIQIEYPAGLTRGRTLSG